MLLIKVSDISRIVTSVEAAMSLEEQQEKEEFIMTPISGLL